METLRQAQAQVGAQFKAVTLVLINTVHFNGEVVQTENIPKGYENKHEDVNKAWTEMGMLPNQP